MYKVNQFFADINIGFVNFLRTFSIIIILLLVSASGYTTYHGMLNYVIWQIALVITIAIQAIIVLSTYELAVTSFKIQKPKFFALMASLLVGVAISVNFTYVMFFNTSNTENARNQSVSDFLNKMNVYTDSVYHRKSVMLGNKIGTIQEKRRQMNRELRGEEGSVTGTPGDGVVYRAFQKEIQELEVAKNALEVDLTAIDTVINEFYTNFSIEILTEDELRLTELYKRMILIINATISRNGEKPLLIRPPDMITLEAVNNSRGSPYGTIRYMPLFLAIVVDLLTIFFSYRLKILPIGDLSDLELKLVMSEFFKIANVDINNNNQFKIYFDDCTNNQKYIISLLLNKGYLRRVGKNEVESSERFFDMVNQKIADDSKD